MGDFYDYFHFLGSWGGCINELGSGHVKCNGLKVVVDDLDVCQAVIKYMCC